MRFLPRFALRRPVPTVSVVLALALLAAPGLARLELRTDGRALAPDSPEALAVRRVQAEFGLRDPVVLLVRSRYDGGIFRTEALAAIRALTDSARVLTGGVEGAVTSLATENGDRFRAGTIRFRGLLEPWPMTPEAVAELKEDLAELRIHEGTLVARDGSAATILLSVPEGVDRAAFLDRVRAAARVDDDSLRVDLVGAPVAEALLGEHLLGDLRRLLPVVFGLIALLFAVRFRSLPAVALPMFEIGAVLVLVFGASGWVGVPVYLTTAVLPVILSTMVIADEIHVFTRFAQIRRADPDLAPREAVSATMDEMASPLTKTSLTTAIGFLSFAVSDLAPVRSFGWAAAAGILYCLVFSLTVVPVALARFTGAAAGVAGGGDALPRALARVVACVRRNRTATLAVVVVLVAAGAAGAARLQVQDSWVGGFGKGSAFREATAFFDEQFLGSHLLRFVMRTDPVQREGTVAGRDVGHHEVTIPADDAGDPAPLPGARLVVARESRANGGRGADWSAAIDSVRVTDGGIVLRFPADRGSPRLLLQPDDDEALSWRIHARRFAEPRVLLEAGRFEEFLRAREDLSVGGVLGPATYLETTRYMVTQRVPERRSIPRSPYEIERLWSNLGTIRGETELGRLVNPDRSAGVVTAYLRAANFRDTAALLDAVRAYERDHLAPLGIRLEAGGDIAMSQALISAIVGTQVKSLLFALLGILAVTSWMSRSLRWGALCVLPCAIAVLLVFAGMGLLRVPLGVATSMFAGMCLGIGVDFAIHFVERYRRARARSAAGPALEEAAAVAGPAILLDTLAVGAGFGMLTASSVPLNAHLGLIAVIGVGAAMLATMLVLPALVPEGAAERARNGGPGGCG